MNINSIEYKLSELFHDAIGINDTIWYSESETLYDAILTMIEKECMTDNLKRVAMELGAESFALWLTKEHNLPIKGINKNLKNWRDQLK